METERTSQHLPNKHKQSQNDEQHIQTLNTILAATTEFIALFDTQGRYLYASENIATLLGMKQSDFLGKTRREVGLPAEFMEPFEAQRHKVMTTGQTVMEEMLFPVDTRMRWFEYVTKPIVDARGVVESVVVAWKDITERKQVEEATYRLASIVESSGDAILSKTLQGVITSWNSGAETSYGYTADEIIGQPVSLLIPPERQNEMLEILALIATGETVKNHETTRVRKDGKHRDMSITMSPIRDAKGKIIGASTIAHDITKYKHMVEELAARSHELERSNDDLATRSRELESSVEDLATRSRELERSNENLGRQRDELTSVNVSLEEANRVRSEFLSTMSHELRTPLASIIGFSQMLLDDAHEADWNQEQQNDLERIFKNGQHLLSLINDVLDLSKIEAGRMMVTYSQVDVRELLTSVVEEIQSMALAQHLVLRAEVAEGIDFLESNPLKLRQILLNLVSNAIKFTEQGEVTVSARRVFSSEQQADQIALAVKDTGMGIPAEIQAHIFEAFYQADGSYTRKFGGTGLGLSIVSQLTTLLGGTIEITSAPGQGSAFTLLLPVKAVHPHVVHDTPRLHPAQQSEASTLFLTSDELTPAVPAEVYAVSDHRAAAGGYDNLVLAIDDNPDAINLVRAALKNTPYTVVGVQDSLKAIELVQELRPCAITLDVMMPNLNGWQLLHQLKANPATAAIPVVMLTVLSEATTGYVLGADDYLIKPFRSDILLNTLRHLVEPPQGLSGADQRETQPV